MARWRSAGSRRADVTMAQARSGSLASSSLAPGKGTSEPSSGDCRAEISRISAAGSASGANLRMSSLPVMWIAASTSSGSSPRSEAHPAQAARMKLMVSTRTPSRSNTIARA